MHIVSSIENPGSLLCHCPANHLILVDRLFVYAGVKLFWACLLALSSCLVKFIKCLVSCDNVPVPLKEKCRDKKSGILNKKGHVGMNSADLLAIP